MTHPKFATVDSHAEGYWRQRKTQTTDPRQQCVCEMLALGFRKQALLIELLAALDREPAVNEAALVEAGATTREAAEYRVQYEAGRRVYAVTRRADQYYAIVHRAAIDDDSYDDPTHAVYLARALRHARQFGTFVPGA